MIFLRLYNEAKNWPFFSQEVYESYESESMAGLGITFRLKKTLENTIKEQLDERRNFSTKNLAPLLQEFLPVLYFLKRENFSHLNTKHQQKK